MNDDGHFSVLQFFEQSRFTQWVFGLQTILNAFGKCGRNRSLEEATILEGLIFWFHLLSYAGCRLFLERHQIVFGRRLVQV